MSCQLAQVNIARMRGSLAQQVMAGLSARLEEMNRLADASDGFIWRWRGDESSAEELRAFEQYFVPFQPEHLFYNLSVWASVEALRRYAFKTAHSQMLADKRQWVEELDRARLALWWIPAGHHPSVAESADRLRAVNERGATPYAFTFRQSFPEPAIQAR
jgi:hypothetical protein